jgi:hypothetical protein
MDYFFWHKLHPDGSLARYKARWFLRGITQQEGVDYGETFNLVVKPATVRVVLNICNFSVMAYSSVGRQNAFLHGELSERVYNT